MFGSRRRIPFEPPIELRFVDFFMILVAALMFVAVMLSVVSAFIPKGGVVLIPRITSTALPSAVLHRPYRVTLAVEGGTPPYVWSTRGPLPAGLALAPATGVIAGQPHKIDRTDFVVSVLDKNGLGTTAELSLDVVAAVENAAIEKRMIVSAAAVDLPDAVGNAPYSTRLNVRGGTPPYRWVVTRGALPSGLRLTPSGDVVGSPATKDARAEFTVAAVDANGARQTADVRLQVRPGPAPIWLKGFSLLTVIARWFGYFLVGVTVFYFLFVSEKEGYVHNPGRVAPMTRLWQRLKN